MKTISIRLTDQEEIYLEFIKSYLKEYKCKASTTTVIKAMINLEADVLKKRYAKGLFYYVDQIEEK